MNEVKMAPTMNMRMPMKVMNWVKTVVKPSVRVFDAEAIPIPSRLLNRSKKSVEAILNVKVVITIPVWTRLRNRSFMGNPALLLMGRLQFAVF